MSDDNQYIYVIILPTAGVDRATGNPDAAGMARIAKAVSWAGRVPGSALAIAGGYPDPNGRTFAQTYADYIRKHHPGAAQRMIVDGSSNNTIDDMLAILSQVKDAVGDMIPRIGFVSYRLHWLRLQPLFKKLGYDAFHIPSQEVATYSPLLSWFLIVGTMLDPCWSGRCIGTFLRWLSNVMAAHYWDEQ